MSKTQAIDASTPQGRVDRNKAATEESKALKAWEADGKKGDEPAHPNLDAVRAESEQRKNGGSTKPESTRGHTVVFVVQGKEVHRPNYCLARMAVENTRGIGGKDVKRIPVDELRKILKKAGVDNPEHTEWEVELPNGRKVGAILPEHVKATRTAPAKGQKASTPRAKAAAKATKGTAKRSTRKSTPRKASSSRKRSAA